MAQIKNDHCEIGFNNFEIGEIEVFENISISPLRFAITCVANLAYCRVNLTRHTFLFFTTTI